MRKIQRALIVTVFVMSAVLLSLSTANAQGAVHYKFLEIVDYENKPVVDATVDVQGSCAGGERKTNQKGQLESGFPIGLGDCRTYGFTISKPGYYSFEDLGLFSDNAAFSSPYYTEDLRIELLIIPKNKQQREAIGKEQLKRELIWAVKKGDAATVRKLLKAGIDPNITTNDLRGIPGPKGVSAILYAASFADIDSVKEFLAAGADIRKKDSPAYNILSYYLRANPFSHRYSQTEVERADRMRLYEEGFDYLIKAGADVKAANANGETALMVAVALDDSKFGFIKKVIDKGVPVNARDERGNTVLMRLIINSSEYYPLSMKPLELLLKSGADTNIVAGDIDNYDETYCMTALISAAEKGNTDLVKLLLANKANVNFTCKSGKTALIPALEKGNADVIKALIDAGAGVNASGTFGSTPLMIAVSKRDVKTTKILLDLGASVNATDRAGRTALMLATWNWSKPEPEIVDLLLKHGADPNIISKNYNEYIRCVTALMYAAQSGSSGIIRMLLENKADINLTCENGNAPIFYAVLSRQAEPVKLLLEAGADVKGEPGHRALKFLRENPKYYNDEIRSEEIKKLLEAAGAKEKLED